MTTAAGPGSTAHRPACHMHIDPPGVTLESFDVLGGSRAFCRVKQVPPDGSVRVDRAALMAAPTVFDRVHAAGLRTAAVNWPCTRNARGLDDNFPDVPDPLGHTTPRLRDDQVASGALADGVRPGVQ